MGLTGDFNRLATLKKRIRDVGQPGFKAALLKNLSQEARSQAVDCFQQSRDPYGTPWKPIKHRQGMPLLDTGRLRNSLNARPLTNGFEIGSNVVYSRIHQYGGLAGRGRKVMIPARPFLPDPKNLGPIWSAALERSADGVMHIWMGRRA